MDFNCQVIFNSYIRILKSKLWSDLDKQFVNSAFHLEKAETRLNVSAFNNGRLQFCDSFNDGRENSLLRKRTILMFLSI